jgi:hypothetical protein
VKAKKEELSDFINQDAVGKRVLAELDEKYKDEEEKEPALKKKLKTEEEKLVNEDVATPAVCTVMLDNN